MLGPKLFLLFLGERAGPKFKYFWGNRIGVVYPIFIMGSYFKVTSLGSDDPALTN